MKPLLIAACLLFVPVFAVAQDGPHAPAQASTTTDTDRQAEARRAIEAVIETFRTAIIDKDKTRFLALFLDGGNLAWQDVVGDANVRHWRKTKPDAAKVRVDPADDHRSFIDGIVSDRKRSEETFRNIDIRTDGDIASVIFDYRFLSDGREGNHGKEAWHLVRTDAGWKIVSVIWSTNWAIEPETAAR